jgi:FecR protein
MPFIYAQKPAAASAAATLTIYKGTAQRAPAGSNTFSPVLSGQGLNGGDQVRTGAATAAAIRFGDGSITRLDSNTTVTVKMLTHQGSEYQTSLSQSVGKTWNKVQRLVGVAKFNVTGPSSSTAEVRGTTFVLIIEPNGDVRIDDYQGTVIFHGKAGSVTVTTSQSSTILNGTSSPQPATGIPTADLQDPITVFNIAADANLDATGNRDILSINANNTIAVDRHCRGEGISRAPPECHACSDLSEHDPGGRPRKRRQLLATAWLHRRQRSVHGHNHGSAGGHHGDGRRHAARPVRLQRSDLGGAERVPHDQGRVPTGHHRARLGRWVSDPERDHRRGLPGSLDLRIHTSPPRR